MTKGIHLSQWKQALEHMKIAEKRLKEAECKARAHLWAYLNSNFVRGTGKVDQLVYVEVADAWYKRGDRMFNPITFDCGSYDQVIAALRRMVEHGVLREYAVVSCDGETVWRGPRTDVNSSLLQLLWLRHIENSASTDEYGFSNGEPISFEDAVEYGCIDTHYEYEIPLKLDEPPER